MPYTYESVNPSFDLGCDGHRRETWSPRKSRKKKGLLLRAEQWKEYLRAIEASGNNGQLPMGTSLTTSLLPKVATRAVLVHLSSVHAGEEASAEEGAL